MKTKQLISILLILTLMLSLCGCGMSKEAKAAQALIDAIGEVSLDSESAIVAAEEAVAALSDKDRERLTGLDTLKKARETFSELADADEVSKVEALIDAIGTVDADSSAAIDAAKKAYEGLDDRLKDKVGNADLIGQAEAAYEQVRLTADAAAVEKAIAAIGEVTPDSAEAIEAAKALYEAAPAEVQALIGNLAVLEEAEAALDEIKEAEAAAAEEERQAAEAAAAEEERLSAEAAAVEEAIAAIGEVTSDSGEAIENAKALYEAAPPEVREKVGNLAALTEAETALDEIREAEEAAAAEEERLNAEAAAVEEAIAAIGEVTLDSGEAIENAKALFDALSPEAQARVDNAAVIGEAEAAYEEACLEAEAAPVEEAIASIGEVTLDSAGAIENAKALYDALSPEAQARVDNADAIGEAESILSGLRVEEAERLIDEIGAVDLDSGEAIAAAQAALDALSPEEAAAVSNTAALTEAGESYQTALEDHASALLEGFTLFEDESGCEKVYYPAGWTYYGESPAMNQRCFIRPYIKVSGEEAELRVVYNYTSPDKIYWTGINIYVDDETFSKSFPDEAIARGQSVGTVWEYCDDAADMDLLQAISEAQRPVWFYFVSPAGLSNYRLSATDVEAIRQTLETYDAMLAAGTQPAA